MVFSSLIPALYSNSFCDGDRVFPSAIQPSLPLPYGRFEIMVNVLGIPLSKTSLD
jgi:hypothetical protein